MSEAGSAQLWGIHWYNHRDSAVKNRSRIGLFLADWLCETRLQKRGMFAVPSAASTEKRYHI